MVVCVRSYVCMCLGAVVCVWWCGRMCLSVGPWSLAVWLWLMRFGTARADLVYWARELAQVQRARPTVDVDVGQFAALFAPHVPPAKEGEAKVKH